MRLIQVTAMGMCAGMSVAQQQLPPLGTLVHIAPSKNTSMGVRHCNFLGSVTPFDGTQDFSWRLVTDIDGTGYSFSSANYDGPGGQTYYLSPDVSYNKEVGRLGVVSDGGNWGDALFTITPNGDGSITIASQKGNEKGQVVSQSIVNTGSCKFDAPCGDLVLLPPGSPLAVSQTWIITPAPAVPAPPPAIISIDASHVDHLVKREFLGCHIDPGWTHQPLSWHSNLIYGQSFEKGPTTTPPLIYAWNDATEHASVTGTAALDAGTHVNPSAPAPSLKLDYTSGAGFLGWANRGIGNEGLAWIENAPYEGFVWVLAPSGGKFEVRMQGRAGGSVTASTTIPVAPGVGSWQRLNFTLTPSANATCEGIADGSDPSVSCGLMGPSPGHICVRCGGEFAIGLTSSPGVTAWVGFVQLSPGPWGRFAGLDVHRATADAMAEMGVSVIRQGGTVSQSFRWKDWRGPSFSRPSMQHTWGQALVAPWGPFEFLDYTAAAGITPVLTFAYDLNSAEDWADLVEYCWGDESTTWGAVRTFNDSHPAFFNLSIIELGNEQWNPDFVDQVAAMEARAATLGSRPLMRYMFPSNQGFSAAFAQQLFALGGDELLRRTMPDCHVGESGGVGCALEVFAAMGPGYNISFINAEVNAQRNTMRRAITEAADLQTWFSVDGSTQERLVARTASFCTERSGHFDGFDQGLSLFLPNMTWLQPPGYAHAMIAQAQAQARNALPLSMSQAWPGGVNASAQITDDGSSVFVQLVNTADSAANATANVTIGFAGSSFKPSGAVDLTTLSTPQLLGGNAPWEYSGNTPYQPELVAPRTSSATVTWPAGSSTLTLLLPPYSFTIVQIAGSKSAKDV